MRFRINKITSKYLGIYFSVEAPKNYEGGEVITIDEHEQELEKVRRQCQEEINWQRETCSAALRVSQILRENDRRN